LILPRIYHQEKFISPAPGPIQGVDKVYEGL